MVATFVGGSTFVFAATVAAVKLAMLGMLAMMVYSVYSAITARSRQPSFGLNGGGLDESSSTYGWDGINTIQDVGVPVKIIYGEHRTGGNIINQFISTDGDKQYLNLLIAAGEGEIESISDIKINGA